MPAYNQQVKKYKNLQR